MRQVGDTTLWIGNVSDVRSPASMRENRIEALVDLALEELPCTPARATLCCRFPLMDGRGNEKRLLRAAIETTAALVTSRLRTLVFCSAGMSRSPSIAAAALAHAQGASPGAMLKMVIEHGCADVSPGLWNDVLSAMPLRKPTW